MLDHLRLLTLTATCEVDVPVIPLYPAPDVSIEDDAVGLILMLDPKKLVWLFNGHSIPITYSHDHWQVYPIFFAPRTLDRPRQCIQHEQLSP